MRTNKIFKYYEGTKEEVKLQKALFESENDILEVNEERSSLDTNPAWYSAEYTIKEVERNK